MRREESSKPIKEKKTPIWERQDDKHSRGEREKGRKTDSTSAAYLNKECNPIPSNPQTILNPPCSLESPHVLPIKAQPILVCLIDYIL
jgi:hypothetical protein